jgi:hypothetical protein
MAGSPIGMKEIQPYLSRPDLCGVQIDQFIAAAKAYDWNAT